MTLDVQCKIIWTLVAFYDDVIDIMLINTLWIRDGHNQRHILEATFEIKVYIITYIASWIVLRKDEKKTENQTCTAQYTAALTTWVIYVYSNINFTTK